MTPLDLSFETMSNDRSDAARLAYLHALAASELHVPGGETPEVFETSEGRFVIAFDAEERLAAFADGPIERASLPGRVLAQALAGQGVGLILNPGSEVEFALDPDGLDWLAAIATDAPVVDATRLGRITKPKTLPPAIVTALDRACQRMSGMATEGWLAEGQEGLVLALVNVAPGAEEAVARGIAEAVRFSDWDGSLGVVFPKNAQAFQSVGVRIEITAPECKAPKSDTPPRLR